MRIALLLLFALASPSFAQTLALPPTASGQVGLPIPIVAVTDQVNVTWIIHDAGMTIVDGSFFGADARKAVVFANAPGTYKIFALTAKADKISPLAVCVVSVTGIGPTPPTPVPPGPTPPPIPVDEFAKSLQSAYAADAKAGSTSTDLANLTALYKAAQDTVATDRTLATFGDVKTKLTAAAQILKLGPPPPAGTILAQLRTAIGAELDRTLSTTTAEPLTDDGRSKIAAAYKKVQTALETIK